MEANPRPQSVECVPSDSLLQDGNPGDHQAVPSTRGVGHLTGLQRRLFSCSNKSKVEEVHQGRQGSQVNGTGAGYPNPPVPRRLVVESPVPGNMPTTYPDPLGPMSQPMVGDQFFKVGTGSSTYFQLCRLSLRPLSRSGHAHSGEVDSPVTENKPFGTGDF